MCRDLYQENGVTDISWRKVHEMIFRGVSGQESVIGVIDDVPSQQLQGSICLLVNTAWYSDSPQLVDAFDYVRPEYRKSNNAKGLLEFAKSCSDRLGIPLMSGVFSNQRTEAKIRLFRRSMGAPAGAFFLYNGKTGKDSK